jgi:gliding motility-associated-like protein
LPEGVTFVEASDNGFYIPGTHSVTWFIGELARDEVLYLTLTVRLDRTLLADEELINYARVFSLTNRPNDPFPENNESEFTIWVDMPLRLFIPEGFSPNGDGINDTFVIGGLFDLYPQNKITIIDRWGQFVFSAEPYHENWWDGKNHRGEDMPPGTYYYVLELGPGNSPIRGFIYLAR